MACFMQDVCQYPNCGKRFLNLHDLIIHIEAVHIDFDEANCNESGNRNGFTCVPMSHILKYGHDVEIANAQAAETEDNSETAVTSYNQLQVNTSGAQWYESETNSYSNITSRRQERESKLESQIRDHKDYKLKKYVCPVVGCPKSYKNQNGIKYHITNYHELTGNTTKPKTKHKCHYCDKVYKTFRGLQAHVLTHSEGSESSDRTYANPEPNQNYTTIKQQRKMKLNGTTSGMLPITSPQLANIQSFYGSQTNLASPGYYIDNIGTSTPTPTSCYPNIPNTYEPTGAMRNHLMQQNASNLVPKTVYGQQIQQQQSTNCYKEYYSLGSNPAGTQKWPQYEGTDYNNGPMNLDSQNAFMRPPVGIRQYTTENGALGHRNLQLPHQQQRSISNHYGIYNHVESINTAGGINVNDTQEGGNYKNLMAYTYGMYEKINTSEINANERNDFLDIEYN